jgi:predicted DNA-binding transcriptional regulator AlpA
MAAKPKPEQARQPRGRAARLRPRLLTHREVARLVSIETDTLRDWVAIGEWPEPVAIVQRTWFYRIADVDHFIETGTWPEGVRFRANEGKGRPPRNP